MSLAYESGRGEAASLAPALLARKGTAQPWTYTQRMVAGCLAPATTGGAIVTRLPLPPKATAKRGGEEPPEGPKKRVSFRLDDARRLQLRLLAAHFEESQQALLVAAFDEFVARHAGGCVCLSGAVTRETAASQGLGVNHGAEHDRAGDIAG
jgi:hypothetical protein